MGDLAVNFSELVGKTIAIVNKTDDRITFECADGTEYLMYHSQDCCESVYVESVVGDIEDLIGSPVVVAEESTSGGRPGDLEKPEYEDESQTWTFYKIDTAKGGVTIRWYGSSNGYYSESVDFVRTR
jgi:hypothetical protein